MVGGGGWSCVWEEPPPELELVLSHLMYVLKSKFVTALIPLYSIAAISYA